MAFKNGMRPVHPGEVLREEFLILWMSKNRIVVAGGERSQLHDRRPLDTHRFGLLMTRERRPPIGRPRGLP